MSDVLVAAVISGLGGIIFGGAAALWAGVRPLHRDFATFRVELAEELSGVRERVASLEVLARETWGNRREVRR